MLFDLRSRRRKGAVKVIYASLALIMVVGLVGLGIGTGNSGGLLNAGGNGGSGNGNSTNDAQVTKALATVRAHPTAANWANLMTVRYSAAGSSNDYNSTTGVYTAGGKTQLRGTVSAWQGYLRASAGKPTLNNSIIAARAYQALGQWADESVAWNYAAQAAPASERLNPDYCLALSSYAAKETTKGDLAATAALALTAKAQRLTQKSTLKSARTSPTTAQSDLATYC